MSQVVLQASHTTFYVLLGLVVKFRKLVAKYNTGIDPIIDGGDDV